ncbi:MAG: mannose-1-phosphate guanylyltransferase/mannose-6-phosphate isomerase [Sphingopyxis sp.]|nr:mannose-1-phosphate guanylyltransferase/mannose-6-phosphate isomerase [Sphingopyxis sp.]
MTKIVPVILSGGSGTRLWPMSTDTRPKQFLPLASEATMFADTLDRCGNAAMFAAPLIVGAARHADLLDAEAPAGAQIILEPVARNTAPAIALAALVAGDDALLLVMPSDHVIADRAAFAAAVEAAIPAAEAGWLVTFGITPTGPETGFGYIAMGHDLPEAPKVRHAKRFIEKPPRADAEALLAEGSHVWNAGIFLLRANRLLDELTQHGVAMLAACRNALIDGESDPRFIRPDAKAFAACPSDSIDYAVMERAERVAVVPVSCGWSDVGSWDALAELGPHDAHGNRLSGDVISIDTTNSLVLADGMTVTLAGVSDLIVVASGSHVMIVPRGQSQDVKRIVEAMKARISQA